MRRGSSAAAILAGMVLLCSGSASGQQSASKEENAAADQIARLVERTRQQSGVPRLRRISDSRLRVQACERAERGDDSAAIGSGFFREKVGTTSYVLYSIADPTQPSPELLEWAGQKAESERDWTAHRFAVGVCFKRTAQHPEGRYWVCAAKYLGAIKSFFYSFVWD
jgi:hypothetical protein